MKIHNFFFTMGMALNLIVIVSALVHLAFKKRRMESAGAGGSFPKNRFEIFGLSKREEEIAISILAGKTNHEIAQEKYIAVTTVKKHVYNLFNKTSARNRIELINRLRSQM